jgi:pyruvate/2-oxoglutarate dehydrogenase complex dihydrolipoamide dehydrogenase (E3) component
MDQGQKSASKQYDLTIIGGGSGGLIAGRVAVSLGARVLLIDKERLGGDCLRYGCVPSKSLIHVARLVQQTKNAARIGLTVDEPEIDMGKVSGYIQSVIKQVEMNETSLVEGLDVRFGTVEFQSATALMLNGESVRSRKTIIATGSHPAIPEVAGLADTGYLTNEDVFDLTTLPNSLAIIGGGPIGVELAQALARLGTKVTLIQGPERILPREDSEVSSAITSVLQAENVEIITGARLVGARRQGTHKVATIRYGSAEREIEADELLLALGRQPNVERLNLEAAGIHYDNKGIKVNARLETSAPSVLAIGDVIGGYLFTHVAAAQAAVAVRNALVPIAKKKFDERVVPWCTFTEPEAARVGLTLAEAQQRYPQAREVRLPYAEIDRAQAENATTGFIKLVLVGKKDELVGAHIVGAQAGELLGEISLAMHKKLSLNDIQSTIHPYPTISTGLQQAVFEAYLGGNAARSNRKLVSRLLALRR